MHHLLDLNFNKTKSVLLLLPRHQVLPVYFFYLFRPEGHREPCSEVGSEPSGV